MSRFKQGFALSLTFLRLVHLSFDSFDCRLVTWHHSTKLLIRKIDFMDLNFEMKQGLSELASLKDATNIVQYQASDLYDLESLISLCSFKLIIALRSTETHNIALKNVTLFRSEI